LNGTKFIFYFHYLLQDIEVLTAAVLHVHNDICSNIYDINSRSTLNADSHEEIQKFIDNNNSHRNPTCRLKSFIRLQTLSPINLVASHVNVDSIMIDLLRSSTDREKSNYFNEKITPKKEVRGSTGSLSNSGHKSPTPNSTSSIDEKNPFLLSIFRSYGEEVMIRTLQAFELQVNYPNFIKIFYLLEFARG